MLLDCPDCRPVLTPVCGAVNVSHTYSRPQLQEPLQGSVLLLTQSAAGFPIIGACAVYRQPLGGEAPYAMPVSERGMCFHNTPKKHARYVSTMAGSQEPSLHTPAAA
jgi:hypothetical protein